jgi:TRAP-type C4-dicarboxylate transport system permease small subunit
VLITCQMIFVRFVLNQSTIWQTEAVVYHDDRRHDAGPALRAIPARACERGPHPLALPMRLRKALFFVTMSTAVVIICVMAFYGV